MTGDPHAAWLAAHGDALASFGLLLRVFESAER